MAGNAPRQRRRLRQPWQCGFCNLQNLKEAEEFEENPDPLGRCTFFWPFLDRAANPSSVGPSPESLKRSGSLAVS